MSPPRAAIRSPADSPLPGPAAAPAPPGGARSVAALIRRGWLNHRLSTLTWGGSLGVFSALVLFIWPSIEDSVGELLRSYPEGLKEAFGIGELSSVEEYLNAEMLSLIVPLAVAFLAVRLVAAAVSTPEERAWLDTLLATPLARQSMVVGAFMVAGLVTAGALLVSFALTMVAGVISGTDPSAAVIGRGLANVWPLAMLFAGLAAAIAGRFRGPGLVTGLSSAMLVLMYLIDLLGKLADGIEPLRYASAFRYYGSAIEDGIDPLAFAGLIVAGALLTGLGALLFSRRDISG